jgi:serine/threonine protein kinase
MMVIFFFQQSENIYDKCRCLNYFIDHSDPIKGRLLISKGDFINEHTSDNIREDYQIGKVLGTGAFGEVRVCTHRKSNIKRAVKILKKNFLKEEEQK